MRPALLPGVVASVLVCAACGQVCRGDRVVTSAEDNASHCSEVLGLLVITEVTGSLELPLLQRVGEGLHVVENPELTELLLPSLREAGRLVVRDDGVLESLSLPSLAHVDGDVLVRSDALQELSLPLLEHTGSEEQRQPGQWETPVDVALSIRAPSLTRLELPALLDVDGAVRISSERLGEVALPSLEQTGAQVPQDAFPGRALSSLSLALSRATSVRLPALRSVDGGRVAIHADVLETLALPLLETAGSLVVHGESFASIQLPRLRVLTNGGAGFSGPALVALELPLLESVAGSLSVTRSALETLAFPRLREVDQGFWVGDVGADRWVDVGDGTYAVVTAGGTNPELRTIDLPALERAGALLVVGNHGVAELELPSLSEAGVIVISDNEALTSAALPALVEAEHLFIGAWPIFGPELATRGLPSLRRVDLPRLTTAHTASFRMLPGLEALSLPALEHVGGELRVEGNEALAELSLTALSEVSSLTIVDNPSLSQCDVDALVAQTATDEVTTEGNAPCP